MTDALTDSFDRKINYLRVSITDQCNERCLYCRPNSYRGWSPQPDHLSTTELIQVISAAIRLGFEHVRLTGGEPLLRTDLLEIIQGIRSLPHLTSLSLSTNGTRLGPIARQLQQAGIDSVNLSLDALQPELYRKITGGSFDDFFGGFRSALDADFTQVKLNCVLLRGINQQELRPLVHFAAEHQVPIRFIELMPLTLSSQHDQDLFFSIQDAQELLGGSKNLIPKPDFSGGHGPARYFEDKVSGAIVGFIGALTTPDFCASCNKIRLTADGKLRPCLGRHGEIDLRTALRQGSHTPEELLREAIANKPKDHEFTTGYEPSRPMTALGG
jgi:cyclic pyranopterin phosphate synthase